MLVYFNVGRPRLGGGESFRAILNLGKYLGEGFSATRLDIQNRVRRAHSFAQTLEILPRGANLCGTTIKPREIPTLGGLRATLQEQTVESLLVYHSVTVAQTLARDLSHSSLIGLMLKGASNARLQS